MSREEVNQVVREAERRRRSLRPPMRYLLPAVAALGVGGAVAAASIPGSDHVVHGCYITNTVEANGLRIGALRVIDPSLPSTTTGGTGNPASTCDVDETHLDFNQQGPAGAQGVAGSPGAPGSPGGPGSQGAPLIAATTFGGSSASKAFLKIEGVDGGSTDALHKGWIALSSFSFGPSQVPGDGGKTVFKGVKIPHPVQGDFDYGSISKTVKLAVVDTVKGHEVDVLTFTLTGATGSAITGNSPTGAPMQEITLGFTSVTEKFQPFTSTGHKLSPVVVNAKP
jgi:type VI protein secretion system component Hcp